MEDLCAHLKAQNPILPLCFKRTSVLMQSNVITGLRPTAAESFYSLPDCTIHLKASSPATDSTDTE
jgi:hypothetical protein